MVWRTWAPEFSAGTESLVLLIHGGSGSWRHWQRNIPALLDAGHTVWAPDLPGFGDSDAPPGNGDADSVVAPLVQGMHLLFGGKPCRVVAFSFGSLVTALSAATHPEVFSRALFVGMPVLPLPHGRGISTRSLRNVHTEIERNEVHRANLAAIMIHDPARIDDEAIRIQAASAPLDRMRNRKLVTTDLCQRTLKKLQMGFECVYGQQDVLYRDQWRQVRQAVETCSTSQGLHFIDDAGHWVQFEQAERFNKQMLTWLRLHC